MKIKEIVSHSGFDNPDYFYDRDLPKFLKTTLKPLKIFPNYKNYELIYYYTESTGRYLLIAFDNKSPIAMLSIKKNLDLPYRQVYLTKVKSSYQNQGIAVAMYIVILKNFGPLLSDYEMTMQGRQIWRSMYRNSSLLVQKFNMKIYPKTIQTIGDLKDLAELEKVFEDPDALLLLSNR